MRNTTLGVLYELPLTRDAKIDRLDYWIELLSGNEFKRLYLNNDRRMELAQLLYAIRQGLRGEARRLTCSER